MIGTRRVAQFAQGLGFDLADAFAGYVELFSHFFQGVVGVHVDAEAHSQYFRFPGGEAAEDVLGRFPQAFVDGRIYWRVDGGVFDEVAQV